MNTKVMFSSKTDKWGTPQEFFDRLNAEFNFDIDVCATEFDHKCEKYFTPEQDALTQKWEGRCFCNPPYGRSITDWVAKAYRSALDGAFVCMLLPARTDTKWFHRYILPFITNSWNTDLAYIAGIVDGEGCIMVHKTKVTKARRNTHAYYQPRLSVKMTDFRLIKWLRDYFNLGSLYESKYEDKKDILTWDVRGEDARKVLTMLYQYLKTKQSQAFRAIEASHIKMDKTPRKNYPEYLDAMNELHSKTKALKKEDDYKLVRTEIRFVSGRLHFNDAKNAAPFPSMVVLFWNKDLETLTGNRGLTFMNAKADLLDYMDDASFDSYGDDDKDKTILI